MTYLFGPVPSRRLGRSLGVDIIPFKVCSYDCVYCQLGKTTEQTISRKEYVPHNEVIQAIKNKCQDQENEIDYITFSGSGEPTLHANIGTIIDEIKKITHIPVAVLTNGSLFFDPEVRRDLLNADLVMPSLDSVIEDNFLNMNRPHPDLKLHEIIEGLSAFTRVFKNTIWLEVMIAKNINDDYQTIKAMAETIKDFNLDLVQLNTVVRPPAEPGVKPISSPLALEEIADVFGEVVVAELVGEFCKQQEKKEVSTSEVSYQIHETLKRRPQRLGDLSASLGIPPQAIIKHLQKLLDHEVIETHYHNGNVYYMSKSE